MSRVILQPSGKVFAAASGETVLAAGIAAGLALPFQCGRGDCGTCRATVLDGEVTRLPAGFFLNGPDACLLCRTEVRGDVTIACDEVDSLPGLPLCALPARVAGLEKPVADVAILRLTLPPGHGLVWRAGQHVQVRLRDGSRHACFLATAPGHGDGLELHIPRTPGDSFADQVFGRLRVRDMLWVEGPFGRFHLDDDTRPVILLAEGVGLAPLKAMVEEMASRAPGRPATLYWSGRRAGDLYSLEHAEAWARTMPGLTFVPVLAAPEAGWRGRIGTVPEAVLSDHPDLSGHVVRACGSPEMVAAVRSAVLAQGGLAAADFSAATLV